MANNEQDKKKQNQDRRQANPAQDKNKSGNQQPNERKTQPATKQQNR